MSRKIDTATFYKIEKGDKRTKREHVTVLPGLLDLNSMELAGLWLADKVYEIIGKEEAT
jgi:hypothetical protein